MTFSKVLWENDRSASENDSDTYHSFVVIYTKIDKTRIYVMLILLRNNQISGE